MRYVLVAALVLGCSTDIRYIDESGHERQVTIKDKLIESRDKVIDLYEPSYYVEDHHAYCSYYGYCFGMVTRTRWRNGRSYTSTSYAYRHGHCSGHRYEREEVTPYVYHYSYRLKTGQVIEAVKVKSKIVTLVDHGHCH